MATLIVRSLMEAFSVQLAEGRGTLHFTLSTPFTPSPAKLAIADYLYSCVLPLYPFSLIKNKNLAGILSDLQTRTTDDLIFQTDLIKIMDEITLSILYSVISANVSFLSISFVYQKLFVIHIFIQFYRQKYLFCG
jgi:hypothetical protein